MSKRREWALSWPLPFIGMLGIFAICASMGPLIAGRVFDVSGAYYNYFLLAVPLILLSTVLIALVPPASRT